MNKPSLQRQLTLPLCFCFLAAGAAYGGSFSVSPILVTLPADGSPEIVRLRNLGNNATLVQVEAVEWAEDPDAARKVQDVLTIPPVFEVGGNQEQIVRLALRRPHQGQTEQAYRLLVTEVPREVQNDGSGLAFALRLNLPLFVTPEGAEPEPVFRLRPAPDGRAELVVENYGTAHLQVKSLRLVGAGQTLMAIDQGDYVLAGESKAWPVEERPDFLPPDLQVHVESNQGPITAPVE